jgi:hypothetical protein
MQILARDADVLRAIGRFSMLTSKQIEGLIFRTSSTRTPFKNVIRRLYGSGLVERIEKRVPGGALGGSGQYVYKLSREGWKHFGNGKYPSARTVNYHALDVATAYISLLDAEEEGWLKLRYAEVEEEARHSVQGIAVRPDLYAEVDNLETRRRKRIALEIDKGSENRPQIFEKLDRYMKAREYDTGVYEVFPQVIFLVSSQLRAEQLRRWIREKYRGDEPLFVIAMLDDFPAMLR